MDLQDALRQPFDAEKALAAYRHWVQSDKREALDQAVSLLLPLVTIVLWQDFRGRTPDEQEDLTSSAVEWVLRDVQGKKFRKLDDAAAFTFYWRVSIKTTMLGFIRSKNAATYLDYGWHCREFPYVRQPAQQETELSEFRQRLPEVIKDAVLDDIRFDGQAYKACVYILEQLLEDRPVVTRVLVKRYGLKNPQFYRDYIAVLIRKALYNIRPSVDEREISREDLLKATRLELLAHG